MNGGRRKPRKAAKTPRRTGSTRRGAVPDSAGDRTSFRTITEMFLQIAGAIQDVFLVMEYPTLRPLYCSPGTKEATGYPAGRIVREPGLWRRTTHPEDLPAVIRALKRSARHGNTVVQFRLLHRNGSWRWIEMNIAPVRNAQGRVIRLTCLHRDITDRKRAEKESRRRQEAEALISRVSTILLPSRTIRIQSRIERALRMAGLFLGVDRCVLRMPSENGEVLSERAAWTRPGVAYDEQLARDIVFQRFQWGWARLRTGKPILIHSPGDLPRNDRAGRKLLREMRVRSFAFIPLVNRGRLQAVISFASLRQPMRWSPPVVCLGRALGRLLLKLVQHAAVEAEAQQREQMEALIARASRDLFRADVRTIEERTNRVLKAAARLLGADRAVVCSRRHDAEIFSQTGSWTRPGITGNFPVYRNTPADAYAFIGREIVHRRDIIASRLDDLPPQAAEVRTNFAKLGIRSFILVSILSWKGFDAGIYFATLTRERTWAPADVRLARTLGDLIIKAVHHCNAEESLRTRLTSESTVRSISRRLVDAAAGAIDAAITWGLEQLGRHLSADQCAVFRFSDDQQFLTETHWWCTAGTRPTARELDHLPMSVYAWAPRQLLAGREIVIRSLDDFPPEAAAERRICIRGHHRCMVLLPFMIGTRVLGSIGWSTVAPRRIWSEEDLRTGRLVGDLVAGALARKWSEEALRASESRHRRFTADAPDGIYVLTPNGRIRDANPAASAQTLRPLATLTGQHIRRFLPTLDRRLLAHLGRRLIHDGAARLTCTLRSADGRRLMAEVHANLLPGGETLAFVRDVSERHRAERALMRAATQEQERIGRDLHDSLGQQLTGLSYLSEALRDTLQQRGLPESFDAARISEMLQRAVKQTRFIAHNLAAVELEERGLPGSLERLAAETQSLFNIRCEARATGDASPPTDAARVLHLIATEAVSNALRHGRPTRIRIALTLHPRRTTLQIDDDGQWKAPSNNGGIGLQVMRHRAMLLGGRLSVGPRRPRGTRVACVLPTGPILIPAGES